MFGSTKFEGVTFNGDEVRKGREVGPLAGAHATVDSAGAIDKRVTATRLILAGPLAFGLRKKKDSRELYLLVEGQGFAFVVEVDPKKGKEAREFAAKLNAAASKATLQATAATPVSQPAPGAPALPPPPPTSGVPGGWYPDPSSRFDYRYFDGARWTEHVSVNGANAVDPI